MGHRFIKRKPPEKLNLTSILDAIFIFIFFLLASAQFIEVRQIGSDVPAVAEAKPNQKEPLNLTLAIFNDKIEIRIGLNGQVAKVVPAINGEYDLDLLYGAITDIKKGHQEEESVIIKPAKDVIYKKIVKILDVIRSYKKDHAPSEKAQLFPQVIFESMS